MAEIINGVPIGDLPGIGSVPDDSMLVVEFLGKAYSMPGAVLRQMIQDVLDAMGSSVDDVTESRLTAAIETVLAEGKYNGVSPIVEVLDEEDGTSVIHVIDAFGDKRYPVEVKGATDAVRYKPQSLTDAQKAQARANIGALSAADISDKDNEIVIVKISGSLDAGYTVFWGDFPAPAGGLNALVENGSVVIGIADGDLTFPLAGFGDYTVPSGTVFSYSPHDFSNNGTFWVNHVRDFMGMPDNKSCVLKSQSDGSVWTASVITEQYTFYLTGDYPGRILQYDGVQMIAGRAFEILQDAVNNDAPIFCFQKDAAFEVEGGGTYTPPIGTPFYYNSEAGAFRCERDGFDCTLTVGMFGYTVIAEKTTPYKTAESKADDLKEEDGTLFLLSAGEPIGAGVPLPTGNADDCKIFIADLNTSTYEDIKAADDAGKICYALWGGYTACMLTTLSPESAIFTTLLDPHLGLYVKFTKGTVGVSDFGLTESHSVLYEPQSLTDAQKAQARENIGALSADDIDVDSIGSNVFVGNYDTVTFAEIKTAHDAGKVCFLNFDGLMIPLLNLSDTDALFVREINSTTDFKVTITSDSGKDFTLVDKNTPIYVAQTLTDDQKAQARTNIGALGTGGGTITGALSINDKLTQGSPSGDASVASMNRFHSDLFVQGNGTAPNTPTVAGFYLGKSTSDENRHMDIVSGGDYSYIDFNKAGRGADFDARLLVNVASGWTDFMWGSHGDITQRVFNVNGSLRQNGTEVLTWGNAGTDSILPARLRSFQEESVKIGDPDYATETGFYYIYGLNNRPPFSQSTNIDYRVLTTAHSSNWLQQIATDFRCGDMFLRRRENGTWTPWVRFATAGDLSSYLPLGGGLMTGSLKFQDSSLPQKSLEFVCGIDAFANGGEMGWQSKAEFLSGYATTGGNVNTSTMPLGFASRVTGAEWGNTIGTSFTSWNDPTGGSIDFRQDNPSGGKMSIKVDGRVYVNEGNNPVMGTEQKDGYWGMTSPDGEPNTWIRTTEPGILPYQSGGAGSGHCYIGTSGWYFGESYIDRMYSTNLTLAGRAYMNDWIQCNAEAGLLFPNHNGLHIMPNTVSHYTPLRIVGERNGYNGVLFGSDTTGLHVMSQYEHQGFYNQSTDCWITYYNRVNNKIGIGTSGWDSYSLLTIGGATYVRGPVKINGVEVDDGSGQLAMLKALSTNIATSGGSWIGRAMFGAKNLTFLMGTYNGLAGIGAHSWSDAATGTGAAWAPMYFNPDGAAPMYFGANGPGWTADRGTLKVQGSTTSGGGTVDVYGTLRVNGVRAATVNDLTYAAGGPLIVTVTGDDTNGYAADKTYDEIMAAWDSGRDVIAKVGEQAYRYSYCVRNMAVSFSFFNTGGTDRVNMEYIVENLTIWHASVGFSPTIDRNNFIAELA